MTKVKCKRCGYEWITNLDKPKCCPRCKRYDYDKEDELELLEVLA